jgi:dolichol-phosphate mannosyltransferase
MKTLVILPTYNEAANIAEVLRRIRAAVSDVDVLVVDDGSPDGTADMAEALAGELGGIEVLRRPAKSGLGSAYRAGFRRGLGDGYEALVEMDADLSHDPATLPDLIGAVAGGADLAIGTRYMPGGRIPDWSWHRRAVSRIGNRYARGMLGISPRDSTSGFRCYHRRALEAINLESVKADGYGFQVEMAYLVERNGGTVAEVPIEFRDRTLGHSKMSSRIVIEALTLVTFWGLRDRTKKLREGAARKQREGGSGRGSPPTTA